MIGKLGTTFGRHGLNIELAAVGHRPDDEDEPSEEGQVAAVMAVTTDRPVPSAVLEEIVAEEGFVAARFVNLAGTLG